MPVYKVNIKWGKEKFDGIEANTDDSPELFKAQVFALSGVAPDRQKIMFKGATLKDDVWNLKLKDNATLLMMGSADALPQVPAEVTKFVEDMTDTQLAAALELPPGLANLGNTCYMNATLQCLRSIPELRSAVQKYTPASTSESAAAGHVITSALRDLFGMMEQGGDKVVPYIFLSTVHRVFPQFAQEGEGGVWAQQDANECWTEIVRCLQQRLPSPSVALKAQAPGNFIDNYMGLELSSTLKCTESEDEQPVTLSNEKLYQLSCFIGKDVKYMHTGLRSRMSEHITKKSPTLDRDAVYEKTSKICRLPGYLAIQFVRFYFKEKDAVNAKILKDVKFEMNLDMFDLCDEALQQRLTVARDAFQRQDELQVQRMSEAKAAGKPLPKEDPKEEDFEPYSFADDPGSNNSGYYELQAVLTHKGRASNSGHYVAWCKRKGDEWLMFDDDKVGSVAAEDILRLSGGGDWHISYVLLYGPKRLRKGNEEPVAKKAMGDVEEPMEHTT